MQSNSLEKEQLGGEQSDESSTHSDTTAAENEVLRKVDWHILPMVFLYYLISFLDR